MVFCVAGFGGEEGVFRGEEPIRVRLNSEKVEDGSAVFHVLRGASCRDVASSLVVAVCLMSINGKMKRRSGFGTIIAKTRGHVLLS